jgi:RND family efflux transporter MFP subunit
MRLHHAYLAGPLFVALALCLAGCSSAPPAPSPEAPKVTVMHPVKRELTPEVPFNGWLEADRTVDVRARVRGHIVKVNFTDGQIVEKGHVLFVLDPREFDAQVGRASDRVDVFKAQLVAAEKEEARLRDLQKKGGASVQQVEKAEAEVLSLKAQISSGENEVKRAKLDREFSEVKAEIGGRVSKALLTEGNLVNAGGTDPLLTTIVSIDPIRVYFNVDERSLARYARRRGVAGGALTDLLTSLKDTNASFTFALDGEREFTHKGTLRFGDNRIDPSTGTLQVYGTVPNKDGRFLPGARVRVRLPVGTATPSLLIPDTAILSDQDRRYVLIADDKNTARRRDVTLGPLTDDSMRAIQPADRLADGEKAEDWWVIVDNLQRVRLNSPVEPEKKEAASKDKGQEKDKPAADKKDQDKSASAQDKKDQDKKDQDRKDK